MTHGWEELGDGEGENGGVKAAVSVFRDQIHQDEADICGGVPANAPKLAFMEEVVLLRLELQALGDNFGEQFANCV